MVSKQNVFIFSIIWVLTACSGVAGNGVPVPTVPAAVTNERIDDTFDHNFQQWARNDAIPPIYDPEFAKASRVDLRDDELVMGVTLGGAAKAYPVTTLQFREMVNDELAGIPILVTWWPICYTGLVHDRRINGETFTFGNASSLYMSAMTWWDHETRSVWSQPWGRAIEGNLKGVELFLLPSQVTTWESWRSQHPNTLVMTNDSALMPNFKVPFYSGFVIGVTLAGDAKAFRYDEVAQTKLVNDQLGNVPILIWAADNSYHTYIRDIGTQTLTFVWENDQLVDVETGSTWNVVRGLAEDGPLRGQVLQALPSLTAYEDHWFDFYPESVVWGQE